MHLSTRKLAPIFPLKSTTPPHLTELWIRSYQILEEKKVLHEKINLHEVWETFEILASNFAPLTYMENLKNLEGSERLWISSRAVNLRSIFIFRVNKDLGIFYATTNQLGF